MKKIILFICACLPAIALANGFLLSGTRLIYNAAGKEASIFVENRGSNPPQLVQSWVSDKNAENSSSKSSLFVVLPPIFKLSQEQKASIRVVYTGEESSLPDDRESLFFLNVKAIPAVTKQLSPHRIIVNTQSIIKLIYRPKGLNETDALNAISKVTASVSGKTIILNNPTPYIISLGSALVDDKQVDELGYIEPFNKLVLSSPSKKPAKIVLRGISDFGGLTEPKTISVL